MFDNCHLAPKDIRDYLPHDCTNSPAPGKAFCVDHCDLLVKLKIPTGLREFIAYCKAYSNAYSKEEKSKVKVKLSEIANTLKKEKVKGTASYDSQGLSMILRNKSIAKKENFQMIENDLIDCQKKHWRTNKTQT